MDNTEITDPLFREAVEAIDRGHTALLERLLTEHPELVRERLSLPGGGYFKDPFLLWFVADNPIRVPQLPSNIAAIAGLLIEHIKLQGTTTLQEQLDYALGLVATGRIPKECGVQTEMMDLLIDAGAKPGGALGALAHGNVSAAVHLIDRGGLLTFAAAIGLERMDDVNRLAVTAGEEERLTALTVASFYGKPHWISLLLDMGVDPNGYPGKESGFHWHATPLHQAVSSGSLDAVKLLVAAGARLDARDRLYEGTPLGWAQHMQTQEGIDAAARKKYERIGEYLGEWGTVLPIDAI